MDLKSEFREFFPDGVKPPGTYSVQLGEVTLNFRWKEVKPVTFGSRKILATGGKGWKWQKYPVAFENLYEFESISKKPAL